MKITETVNILQAHRLGKGDYHPILVYLKNAGEKGKIFKKVSELKEAHNADNKKYSVRDQLPPRLNEKSNRSRNIVWHNRNKMVDQLELSFKNGELQINKIPYRKLVHPPTTRDILKASNDDKI